MAYRIETFAWNDDRNLLIKTYYPMPESAVGETTQRSIKVGMCD